MVSVSTFPPRECGIATFTRDFSTAFNQLYAPGVESKIVALNIDDVTQLPYSKEVIAQIAQPRLDDYVAAAHKLNALPQVKLVTIQHEFGIFGGAYGDYLLTFTEELKKPTAITFHTVLPKPTKGMRRVVQALTKGADVVVVMTHGSRRILEAEYAVPGNKIAVIPHGIHPVVFEPSRKAKKLLGMSPDHIILSTFGLLSRVKGIEYVIDALPEVTAQYPDIRYLIIGATHPVVIRQEGESYRNSLVKRIHALGLTSYVTFYDEYLETGELLKLLQATDIYLATPLDPYQAVSGTLSYALGAGRPVIATAFAQAKEDVTAEVGVRVDFKKPEQITEALLRLLRDPPRLTALGKAAYFRTRNMTWPNVAIAYMRTFAAFVPELNVNVKRVPKIKLSHLVKLTDDFGVIQFAQLAEPDPGSGYTVDDNARALVFAVRYYRQNKSATALRLANTYLNFLRFVQNPGGAFANYVNSDRELAHEQNAYENLDDANGRALYALAVTATAAYLPKPMRESAGRMYEQGLVLTTSFTSPRANAFCIKSLALLLKQQANAAYVRKLTAACDFLVRLYTDQSSSEWKWFEPVLTYSNATLSEALLIGYAVTGNPDYLKIGKITLDFLISQTFENDMYSPIGQQGWFKQGSHRHEFDQQPEDTASMIETLKTMFDISKDARYQRLLYRAFDWFLGTNLRGQIIYDQKTGGCYDGLGEYGINLNEGAESTISYLLSRLLLQTKKGSATPILSPSIDVTR